MVTLVIYDIPDDRRRTKVAEACLDYGLQRIQWSAFLGDLSPTRRRDLAARFTRIMQGEEGNIQFYPLCTKDFDEVEELVFGNHRFGVKEMMAARKEVEVW